MFCRSDSITTHLGQRERGRSLLKRISFFSARNRVSKSTRSGSDMELEGMSEFICMECGHFSCSGKTLPFENVPQVLKSGDG